MAFCYCEVLAGSYLNVQTVTPLSFHLSLVFRLPPTTTRIQHSYAVNHTAAGYNQIAGWEPGIPSLAFVSPNLVGEPGFRPHQHTARLFPDAPLQNSIWCENGMITREAKAQLSAV